MVGVDVMGLDFLFIGAPRSGSTWLSYNLQDHPEVHIPPCKNILYFHPRFQIYRLKFFKYFAANLWKNPDPEIRKWYRKFFFTPFVNDRWYLDLVSSDKVSGEIAEAYCSLEEKDVERIYKMNPDLKIIFVMRNPFERALSHAKLGLVKRKNKEAHDVPDEKFIWHLDHPSSEARSFYTRTLDLWSKYFPEEQFFIRFYEDLQENPAQFIQEICQFLGVDDDVAHFKEHLNSSVNVSKMRHDDFSPEVLKHAAQKYHGEVKELAQKYGGPAELWVTDLETILKKV